MSQTTSNGRGAFFLCLDTSTPTARVAILDGDPQSAEVIRFAAEATAERHAGHLLPLCAEALRVVPVPRVPNAETMVPSKRTTAPPP